MVFVGTAGSGKTSLTRAYGSWLEERGYSVSYVNLDPGVKILPYDPDVDVREKFTVEELMLRTGLGPNGAFMLASDLLAQIAEELALRIAELELRSDFVLVDTPGQMEMFVYRESGPRTLDHLRRVGRVAAVFVVDGAVARSEEDLIVLWLTSLIVQLKLTVPVVPVFNKSDLIVDRSAVERFVADPSALTETLERRPGLTSDLALRLVELVRSYGRALRPVLISAARSEGLEVLHAALHELFCVCGDLS
ncbi:MAG: ATP/GTP-binding protein [Fervidicoccaceae archaeon]